MASFGISTTRRTLSLRKKNIIEVLTSSSRPPLAYFCNPAALQASSRAENGWWGCKAENNSTDGVRRGLPCWTDGASERWSVVDSRPWWEIRGLVQLRTGGPSHADRTASSKRLPPRRHTSLSTPIALLMGKWDDQQSLISLGGMLTDDDITRRLLRCMSLLGVCHVPPQGGDDTGFGATDPAGKEVNDGLNVDGSHGVDPELEHSNEDGGWLWMSSTLKKRRAKMNKHKLRKRRKKLRLKTKK